MRTEDFDRIRSLGFWITIDWNLCFSVDFQEGSAKGSNINVLICSYDNMPASIGFSEMIDQCVDIFYEWYNDKCDRIDKMTEDELFESSLGNITKRVRRNLSIDKLL